jgi:sporulation protein YlmC with PRC-barrel domain
MEKTMKRLSDLKKTEVISADGKIIGTVASAIITGKLEISGLSIKLNKEMMSIMGKKKPFFSSLLMDINIEEIQGVQDKVVLHHVLKELGTHLNSHNEQFDAGRLLGMQVLGIGGKIVGTVEDINIDVKDWNLPSLVVKIRKDALDSMKMEKCLLGDNRLHISVQHIVDVGDYVMLEVTAENIGEILENTPIKKM